jgi:hypothetical protein
MALARSRGIRSFNANLLADNRPVIEMIRHAFPGARFERAGSELEARISLL